MRECELAEVGGASLRPAGSRADYNLVSKRCKRFVEAHRGQNGHFVQQETHKSPQRTTTSTVGAITDYNGIRQEWFTLIAQQAKRKGITLFPGAEVSFKDGKYGLHVLAIFDETAKPDEINSFILSMDRDPATPLLKPDGSHRDIDPKGNVTDLLLDLKN